MGGLACASEWLFKLKAKRNKKMNLFMSGSGFWSSGVEVLCSFNLVKAGKLANIIMQVA
jgi:hypothetical protein